MLSFLFGSKNQTSNKPRHSGRNQTRAANQCANYMSKEPGIYQLENFYNRGVNPQNSCLPGFNPTDGYGIPQNATDVSSQLRHVNTLTNLKEINQFGALPLPSIPNVSRGCHAVDTESALIQGKITYKEQSCIPRETNFHPERSFQIFDSLCYNPNEHAVEPFRRGGVDTRHDSHRRQCGNRGYCRCPNKCQKCRAGVCGCGVVCKC